MNNNMDQDALKALEVLSKHEEAVGRLYQTYAEKFPTYKDFWQHLFKEELVHSQWVRSLYGATIYDSIVFDSKRFSYDSVQASIDDMEKRISEAKDGHVSIKNALSIALDIEDSLIEKDYYSAFSSKNDAAKRVLAGVKSETDEHMKEIKGEMNKLIKKNIF